MSRCHSWRPLEVVPEQHAHHLPGECRKCWKPCFRKTDDGAAYCDTCLERLTQHPFGLVRTALAADAATPDDTLDFLMTDHDPGVAKAAERTYMRRMQGL
ncbi:MAG: hypothetical protein ACTIA2_11255 [Brevibacterium aurantiacum]|uniref:Uncharacterized protein n=2 Tax=Brevibacterium TaxID=1696 RepID=A0A2H1KNY8_BREAU|nr:MULTISPECIES: hypothetical protein [Brevibacterium]AOP54429.1 hypothetical protein BLSMQ_2723 [Brevibacterium aurantiacum]RCT00014.1 hypothetical protein CIK60_03110 [Brevibacterium aurantiacum]SMY00459.1 hypothetical protein BAURA63_03446 [Brevibacterium aurantiacum]SMY01470.1 hypothetical protein BAURA86_03067 [Brevibacterium aurantiacum]